MELKSAEEILTQNGFFIEGNFCAVNEGSEHHEDAIRAMHAYASQAVRMALKEAAERGKIHGDYGNGAWLSKDSILSLESEIIAKLK